MSTTALKPFGLRSFAAAGKLPAAPETSTSIGPASAAKAASAPETASASRTSKA